MAAASAFRVDRRVYVRERGGRSPATDLSLATVVFGRASESLTYRMGLCDP